MTGAGDCWCADLLGGLSSEPSILDAAALGNATATHRIQAPGANTGIVSLDKIRACQQRTPRRSGS